MPDKLSPERLELLVHKACKQATHDVLTQIGFDMTNPHSIQADLQYLRGIRTGCESIKSNTVRIILTSFIPFVIYMFWTGVADFFKSKFLGG